MRVKLAPFILITLSFLLAGGVYQLWQKVKIQESTVVLGRDGFNPKKIRVKKGATITFINKSQEHFWPASDPHPTHEYLVGFDPQKAIASGDKWSLIFNDAGLWNYHDHLHIIFRGSIEVIDGDASNSVTLTNKYCNSNDKVNEEKCFDLQIRQAVDTEGLESAYKLFSKLYEEGKAPAGCHWTAHLIGEAAYEKYKKGKDIPIDKATSYCGYAYYHGFLEKLLRDNPDPSYAKKFCEDVSQKFSQDPQAADNCYHGIGHGFTEEPPDKKVWGDADAMLKPGLKVCEYLFGNTEIKWEICATGVYTVVTKFIRESKYGFNFFDEKDPFAFCRTQPKRYHRACFGEFAAKLDSITNWDIGKVKIFADEIDDLPLAQIVVRTAVGAMMQRDIVKNEHNNYVLGCRKYDENLKKSCLEGIIWGFLLHGEPEKEYVSILKFCKSTLLNKSEQDFCFQQALKHFQRIYTKEKIKKICQGIAKRYKDDCLNNSTLN